MAPPLVNEYKVNFVLKRLLETFLGGLRLFSTPLYILCQMIIWIVPSIIIIILAILDEKLLDLYWKCVIGGSVLFIFDFSLSAIILRVKKGGRGRAQIVPSVLVTGESGENNVQIPVESQTASASFLSQEDVVPNEGFCEASTWSFIAPNISFTLEFLFALIFSSLTFAFCTPLLVSEKVSLILRIFGIFSISSSRYASVISSPAEIAKFNISSPDEKSLFYRPFYAIIVGLGYILFAQFSQDPDDNCVIFWLTLLLALLPLLLGCGILPPLDALMPWGLGLMLLIVSGSSPSVFYGGTVISVLIAILCPIIVFVITQEPLQIVLLECFCGYIITCDTGRITAFTSTLCEEVPTKAFLLDLLHPFLKILTSLICVLITWLSLDQADTFVFEVILLSLTLGISLLSIVFRYLSMNGGLTMNRPIMISAHLIFSLITFLLHICLTLMAQHEKMGPSSEHSHSLIRLIPYLLAIRAYALAVSEPRKSTMDISITFLFSQVSESKVSFVLLLFLCSLLTGRCKRAFRHIKTICSIAYSLAASSAMNDGRMVGKVVLASLLLSPISMLSLCLVVIVEGLVLVPLFTLPIFLPGFTRPTTFFKERWFPVGRSKRDAKRGKLTELESLDWKIYSSIGPLLASSLMRKGHNSKFSFERGECFLGRYEDKLNFIRIVGSGWNYAYAQVKGLEMQEQTSCHHQEAAKIDEIFDAIFSADRSACAKISSDFLSFLMLSPMCTLKLPYYSESKSNITALTNSEEKSIFKDMFYRAFSYLWIKINPALRGESYQRGLGAERKPLQLMKQEEQKENGALSVKNAILRSSKPALQFFKRMESLDMSRDSGRNGHHSDDGNATEPSSDSEAQTARRNSIKQIPVLEVVPQKDDGDEQSPPGRGSRRRSISSPTPARLVDVETSGKKFPHLAPIVLSNGGEVLSSIWVKQCVGDVIPSNAVKARVDKICKGIWDSVIGLDDDSAINLEEFFQDEFSLKLRRISTAPRTDMEDITLKAFRYASKLTLDSIFSTINASILTIDDSMEEDIFNQLTIYEREYRFCSPNEMGHFIQQKCSNIITMSKSEEGTGSCMRILRYDGKGVDFKIGQLDEYTVEGIWANLNFEMLYLTLDDDERFSIQSDRVLLRNIITQCAKPPLGWFVYDAMFRVNLYDFSVIKVE